MLERVNEHLCPDMPEKMFVTCLYGVLDPETGHFRFANAGHDLPVRQDRRRLEELRARGMPLGLMPGMPYEEKETVLQPGDSLLLHSDGIVEAHSPDREMFGFPRLKQCVADYPGGGELIDRVLADLARPHRPRRRAGGRHHHGHPPALARRGAHGQRRRAGRRADRRVRGPERRGQRAPGDRARARARSTASASPTSRLERLKTAVGEATMNAMEHGSRYREDRPVSIRVLTGDGRVRVQITDLGGARPRRSTRSPTSRRSSRACSARAAGASS